MTGGTCSSAGSCARCLDGSPLTASADAQGLDLVCAPPKGLEEVVHCGHGIAMARERADSGVLEVDRLELSGVLT